MAETLSFKTLFQYDIRRSGITVPVRLEWGDKRTECKAKVDSGSSACIFARNYGEDLGLDIEKGWIDRARLGLIDYEGKLYLSDYNDPA